tara:strand:- start:81 stop:251 length:171 start_codon:yes stop_codon:yes gene_type:complete
MGCTNTLFLLFLLGIYFDINILRIYHSKNAKDILEWNFRSSESAIFDAAKQIKTLL